MDLFIPVISRKIGFHQKDMLEDLLLFELLDKGENILDLKSHKTSPNKKFSGPFWGLSVFIRKIKFREQINNFQSKI